MDLVPPFVCLFVNELVEALLFIPAESRDGAGLLMKQPLFFFLTFKGPLVGPVDAGSVRPVVNKYHDAVVTIEQSQAEDVPSLHMPHLTNDGVPGARWFNHFRRLFTAVAAIERDRR